MGRVLTLAMKPTRECSSPDTRDVYDLDEIDLGRHTGLVLPADADQLFLARRRERLDAWVIGGGRLLVNGHPMRRFVEGLPQWRARDFRGMDELALREEGPHPIWAGVDRGDLLLRTGVPGRHSPERMREIGVAGFYARAHLAELPPGARVITSIGPQRLPVDVSYRLGAGEVIVHAGGDLAGFDNPDNSAAGLRDKILAHLEAGELSPEPAGARVVEPSQRDGSTNGRTRATRGGLRRRVAFIHSGSAHHLACLADPALAALDLVGVHAPEMTPTSLDEVDSCFLAARSHPGTVRAIGGWLAEFAERPGAKLVVDGENRVGDWLPGVSERRRGANFWAWRTGEDVGRRSVNPDHPLWGLLSEASVHWHHHGVLDPPPGATPLVVLTPVNGGPARDPWGHDYRAVPGHPNVVLYHDAATHRGEVIASTMDAAYHHGSGFMPGASQLLYRLLDWAAH